MPMHMIDPNQPLKRLSISGQVNLQRKTYWVTRYASIKDSFFNYKKDPSKSFKKSKNLIANEIC